MKNNKVELYQVFEAIFYRLKAGCQAADSHETVFQS
jgi:hypothetical protein